MPNPSPTAVKPALLRYAERLEALSDLVGRGVAWLAVAMVAMQFLVVVLRYAFNLGWIAMQESIVYMHAVLFLLGAAYTLRHDGHVRVDIIYRRLSGRGRAWVNLLGTLLLLWPVAGTILWFSWEYVASAWALLEGSREAGGLPGVFLLKTAMPVMAGLLISQGLAMCLRALAVLRGQAEGRGLSETEI